MFTIKADGSLSPVPNKLQLPAALTVLSPGALGSQATDGSGQYFYAALVDNDPSDSGYLTSSVVYAFKIAASGSLSYVSVFNFTPSEQPDYIFNILTSEQFLYIFGNSNVYKAGSTAVASPDPQQTLRLTIVTQISPDTRFSACRSPLTQNIFMLSIQQMAA